MSIAWTKTTRQHLTAIRHKHKVESLGADAAAVIEGALQRRRSPPDKHTQRKLDAVLKRARSGQQSGTLT
jgi:hypothetical protein